MFPHGNKPFSYGRKNDDDETQLLALGQIISQQDQTTDNPEGDKCHSGVMEDNEEHDALLDGLEEEWGSTGRSSPGQGSNGSLNLDYELRISMYEPPGSENQKKKKKKKKKKISKKK